jgi:hypothetical protein
MGSSLPGQAIVAPSPPPRKVRFPAVYDTLLFLHVLAAFALGATVVMSSAIVLGAPAVGRTNSVSNVLWDVGGLGTLVFGIWLALYVDGYGLLDGWILGAIILWAVATELGRRARDLSAADIAMWHWLRVVAVLGLLALMVFKPGA